MIKADHFTYTKQSRRGRSLLRVLDKTRPNEVNEVRRPVRGRHSGRILNRDSLHDSQKRTRVEGVFVLGQFDGDNAQRPNIRFQTGVLLEDFGRHVRRRAAYQRAIGRGGVELFGETEIAEFDKPLLGNEQVVRLDVLGFTVIAVPTRWMIFLLCR